MAVDPYAICPCGSGKKLKFCCSDLVGDIEKIQRMIDGDQPRAALQHAAQTLARRPGRASLLDLKAKLELTLGEIEPAAATVAEFLEKDPNNPAAHAQQAVLETLRSGARAGVAPLQRAFTLVERSMPRRVLEAIGAVGQGLLVEGNIVAARAHLWLYQGIAGKEDTRALDLLVRLNQSAGLPLLLRDHLYMRAVPEGHPAAPDHDRAQVFASRGMWGPAAQVLDSLCGLYPELPSLVYNRALVYGWLGDESALAQGLHEFAAARPDGADPIPYEDAVEAEALAQLIDPSQKDPPVDVVRLTYEVRDEQELIERFSADPHVTPFDYDPAEHDPEEGPPPRQAYLLLDRPLPDSGEGIGRDEVPRVAGVASHFGRQTDRGERLELVLDKNDDYEANRRRLGEAAGGAIAADPNEERIGESSVAEQALSWRWHFPVDTPPRRRRALLAEQRHEAIVTDWPNTPRTALGGKSPLEAAGDEALRLPLAAAVLLLEQGGSNQKHGESFAALRGLLGLPAAGTLDTTPEDLEQLPIGRVPRLDLTGVGDEQLVSLYQRSAVIGARSAVTAVGREIVNRPGAAALTDVDEIYVRLVTEEDDTDAAIELLTTARNRAEAAGRSTASWDLLELELHIVEGNPEEANRVLAHLRQHHLEEPGVAEQLYQIMYALGATPEAVGAAPGPPAAPGSPSPQPAAAGAADASKIWTPDGGDSSGGGKKLWTPT